LALNLNGLNGSKRIFRFADTQGYSEKYKEVVYKARVTVARARESARLRPVALVERMLDLHRRLAAARLADEKRLLQQQIDVTDKAIDALVYALYALTPEEIAIVVGS